MINIKLTIQYDGSNYSGWQIQKGSRTIQGEIESAVYQVTGENVRLIGSGRTDRGVHANGQVANFLTESNIPACRFKYALNSILPHDISIVESVGIKKEFHSRYDAVGKRYIYIIYNREIKNPLFRYYSYHVPYHLDYLEMKKAAEYFLGTHDFSAFAASNSSARNRVRCINEFTIQKTGDIMIFTIEGNGFLYNMVRIIVGTIIFVGRGKINNNSIQHILESRDRRIAGPTAPPQGLYLDKVFYSAEESL